jgi:hypothetical protein
MTYDEYKSIVDELSDKTKFYSLFSAIFENPLFDVLVNDENAKQHVYTLMMENYQSWIPICLVGRLYPDIDCRESSVGKFDELRKDYMTWIENNA